MCFYIKNAYLCRHSNLVSGYREGFSHSKNVPLWLRKINLSRRKTFAVRVTSRLGTFSRHYDVSIVQSMIHYANFHQIYVTFEKCQESCEGLF